MLRIAYYTQTRTLGYLDSERFTPSEIDDLLAEAGIRTVLVHANTADATILPDEFGYQVAGNVSYCGTGYVVLIPPSTG